MHSKPKQLDYNALVKNVRCSRERDDITKRNKNKLSSSMSSHIPHTSTTSSDSTQCNSACHYQYCPLGDAKCRKPFLLETLTMKHPQEQSHLLLTHLTHIRYPKVMNLGR